MQQLPHAAGASTWQPPAGTATATAAAAATQYPIAPVLPHFGLRHEAAADPQPQQQHSAAAQQVTSSYAATEAYLAGAPEYSNDYEAACASMMWQATRHGPELPAAAVYAAGPGWHLTDPQQQQQHHHGSNGLLQGSSTRGVALPLLRTSLRSSDPTLQTGELGNSLGAAAAGRDSQTKEIAQLVRVADAIESLLGASAKRRTTEPFSSSSSSSSSSTGDACSAGCPAATAAGAAADSSKFNTLLNTNSAYHRISTMHKDVGEGGAGSSNAAQQGAPKEQALLCSKAEAKPLSKSETATEKYPPAKRNWHAAEEGSQEAEEGDMKRRSAVAAAAAAAFPMEAAKKTRTNLMTNILLLVCRQGGSRADFEATLEATKQIRSVFCPHVVNFFEVHLVGDLVCESDLNLKIEGQLLLKVAVSPLRIKPEDSTNTRAGQVQQQQQQREGGEGQKRKRKSNESTGNTGFSLHLSLQKGGPRAAPFASAALRPSSSAAPAAANRSSSSSSKGCQQQQCTPLQQRIKAKRPSDKTEIHAFPGTPEMPSDSSSLTTYVQYTHRGDAVSSSASPGSPNSENVGGPQRSKRKPAPAAPPNRGGPEDTKKLKARNKGLLKKEL
ncbi:hypothetical protein, conserved [Eimeria acervulina]|uniref:Uncharacterized protein n=1 Tax=Eimeria acervulina TaxID=5801 RepID=U6GU95_EIMAC|nr:hypothetical protein, conserved [Eimeria acervulina]CDI83745.1 hypothetical protein, conserved [Eimeria acervulina]